MGGPSLRLNGKGVDIIAGVAVFAGDEIGRDALGNEMTGQGYHGVHGHGATVGAHLHARHGFHTAGQRQLFPAGLNVGCGLVDGFEARAAETVERHSAKMIAITRLLGRRLGDVGALVHDLCDAAKDKFFDLAGIQLIPFPQCVEERHHQLRRRNAEEGSFFIAFPANGAYDVIYVGFHMDKVEWLMVDG